MNADYLTSPIFREVERIVTTPHVVCPTCGSEPSEAGLSGFRCRRGHTWQHGEGRTVRRGPDGDGRRPEPITAPEEPGWLSDAPHPAGEFIVKQT